MHLHVPPTITPEYLEYRIKLRAAFNDDGFLDALYFSMVMNSKGRTVRGQFMREIWNCALGNWMTSNKIFVLHFSSPAQKTGTRLQHEAIRLRHGLQVVSQKFFSRASVTSENVLQYASLFGERVSGRINLLQGVQSF